MTRQDINQYESQTKVEQRGFGVDPQMVLSLLLKNWYYFLIGIVLALIGSRFYIGHTMPEFLSSTSILIKEMETSPMGNNEELLQGLGLPGGMRNMENQIMILTSKEMTERALKELPFEIEFYYKTVQNQIPIYPKVPIRFEYDKELTLPRSTEFIFQYTGNSEFIFECEDDNFKFQKISKFGEQIILPWGSSLRIEPRNEDWLKANQNQKIYINIHRTLDLINSYNKRIVVESMSRGGSMVKISISGTNKARDVDFLNKLAEVFQNMSLDKKNIEAARRIQFIDDQLVGISDSLSTTENKLQRFRSTNMVMDLSAQGQAIISQVNLLENEKARLNLEANYYDYLADYLAKDVSREVPIVPITMGITDPGLTGLVTQLADLQSQLLARGAGEANPLQGLLAQRVRSTKEALLETLNGLRRANSLARSENEEQINKVNRQASALPVTERQLLGIERKFKLNDELYTFLLETRSNLQMQKASNSPDSEVIDRANEKYSTIVAPNPIKVYFIGTFTGFGIPFIILFFFSVFNRKVNEEDLKRITNLPIVGNIPHNQEKTQTVVFDYPNSTIAESFRLLRSRMQFFTKDAKSPVLLITSSMPEEGKTFTSINVASVYSLLGKKTILVGFDLRRPKIFQDFNLTNEKGISTWLIGKDTIEDIIQATSNENLFVITSGPVPPNPSELAALEKTGDLIRLLKERFDYIIIDSSPIGLVSDTFHIASLADACLLVAMPGKTLHDMLEISLREIKASATKGISLVINNIKMDNNRYGYSDKFGYTSDAKKRWKLFNRVSKQTDLIS
jgi:tyrosine-protein kinase Etk/Wzc